ncbi:glycosyltransferase family 4 protein [Turicibacter sanguinis]|uniref:glycosyltransferase family 4 protein n=1 Tax=Turicibacter sanguinis TaxID=154288 RepID=UPI0018AB6270|nr:glycosyltransferase family 4 protein [Turicibacter sanguinis]MDB8564135.1 glycosyltransferase family 4 protein [Turicibacter sanguinis]
MKKALITASVFGFIGSFEKSNINILLKQGYEVHVASNMSSELKAFGDIGQLDGIDVIKHQITYNRSPLSLQTIKSYKEIKKLIEEEKFDLIHCHTPVAAMLTRLAARKVRKKGTKVIYTAHGFHFFKGASILSWLIYFPVEYICSIFTDILITINQEDYQLAKRFMKTKKVEYVPGVGIEVEKFKSIRLDRDNKREELGIPKGSILLLSVGELSKRKNHQVVIEALSLLNDSRIHYCIAGQGDLEEYLNNKIGLLGLQNQVHLLGYRKDISEICKCADAFLFPSLQEGLPVALMEAMACGLPIICSKIRGNVDLIQVNKGGILCEKNDEWLFQNSIKSLIDDENLRLSMKERNLEYIKKFDIEIIRLKMEGIYLIE